jgi:hypothetical protein
LPLRPRNGSLHEANIDRIPHVRGPVEVKLYEHEGELYVLAKSGGRQAKETPCGKFRVILLLDETCHHTLSQSRKQGNQPRHRPRNWLSDCASAVN